jgi:uncharacterized protein (TIGR02598 family)
MYTKMVIAKNTSSQFLPGMKRRAGGFSLVEVTMAVGLVSFCLVAMLGVLPVGLKQERGSTEQLAAMQVLAAVGSDFRNFASGGETTQYAIKTGAGEEGTFYVDGTGARTEQAAEAAYSVWYRVAGEAGSQAARRMHMYVSLVRPGNLIAQNVVVEGIAQQRLR